MENGLKYNKFNMKRNASRLPVRISSLFTTVRQRAERLLIAVCSLLVSKPLEAICEFLLPNVEAEKRMENGTCIFSVKSSFPKQLAGLGMA